MFSQCRKSDRNNESINPAPEENAVAASIVNDLFRFIHKSSIQDTIVNNDSIQAANDGCLLYKNYLTTAGGFPISMVLNFGDGATECDMDGRIRNGKLRMNYDGLYNSYGTVINIEFIGFYVDSFQLSGAISITNRGLNSSDQPLFKVSATDLEITRNDYTTFWNANRTYTWVEGYNSGVISDDVFEVIGNSNGVTSKGNRYTSEIINELVTDYTCNWFVSGQEELVPENLTTRDISYGEN